MANLISIPFRVTKYGEVAKVEEGSDQYYGEQIATIIMTIQGERDLEPLLGIPDFSFNGFQNSALQNQVNTYLPELVNVSADVKSVTDTTQTVTVNFEIGVEV